MDFWQIVIFIVAVLLMLIGLLGTILPMLPGVPIIFVVALVYAIIENFEHITGNILLMFTILTAVAMVLDYVSSVTGIKKMGGSYFGVLGSIIGMIAGIASGLGIVGLIGGSFVGAVLFEMLVGKKSDQAIRAGIGSFIGFFVSGVLRFAIATSMIGIFMWRVLFG